jgi:hypothetical protein
LDTLTDQAVLADIAKNDSEPRVRKAAVERLTDQAALADIAKTHSEPEVRKAALERLTGEAALADIAQTHSEPEVRKAAHEKLTGQALRVASKQKLSGLPTELLIGEYLRHLATDWWAGQPYSRSVATCDACSGRPVGRNKGHLIGSSLWCEDCYRDKDVEGQLRRNPDAAGYGVLQSARRWAQV